ncbi:hypothetical protein GGQ22_04070 [Nocardioides sp. zg-579]|uniref:Uncharacterized protein n=1 Tax=Nocardioides marmotae TaxID=2663857 RepID=A0A6I3IUX6_9ACTN|nr:hypothetical protein [Nocardioides marmotae]MCR6030617.1 hypothetical protein [Gordonia jinghuaiqii]MTB94253.1 hypothetical protein [Nocardioides marmotae]QKE00532.1 hypothetical protein HPC71_05150 [Nocardioides marmotae]
MRALVAVALLVGSAALGVVVAIAAVAVHQLWWGLLLGAAASLAAVVALPARWSTRPPFALGYAAVLAAAVQRRPEGDYLVPADASGYLLLGLALVLLVVAFATLPRPGRARP